MDRGVPCYVAIDIETSGPYMRKNALLAFGVCVMRRDTGEVLMKKGYYLGVEQGTVYDPVTWESFWSKNLDVLREIDAKAKTSSPATVMYQFAEDIDAFGTSDNLTLVSDNPAYDIPWLLDRLQLYMMEASGRSRHILKQTSYTMPVSTECYARGVMQMTGNMTKIRDMLKFLGLEKLPDHIVHDHRPENDAHAIAYLHYMFEQKVNKKG